MGADRLVRLGVAPAQRVVRRIAGSAIGRVGRADVPDERAAGSEPAARRRRAQVRDDALDRPQLARAAVEAHGGGEEALRVRMLRVVA